MKNLFVFIFFLNTQQICAQHLHPIIGFIKNNPDRAAIYFIKNERPLFASNPDMPLPLGNLYAVVLAIVYAEETAKQNCRASQMIPIAAIKKFDDEKPNLVIWLDYMKIIGALRQDSVMLNDLVKGMINFKVNANIDFLIQFFGKKMLTNYLQTIRGTSVHDELLPMIASLRFCSNLAKKPKYVFLKSLRTMNKQVYLESTYNLLEQTAIETMKNIANSSYDEDYSKVWSEKLPHATAKFYTHLMHKINSGNAFSSTVQKVLRDVFESALLEDPINQKQFEHIGSTLGSTPSILTTAAYFTDKTGNNFAFSCLLNDLSPSEYGSLSLSFNEFSYQLIADKNFRFEIAAQF